MMIRIVQSGMMGCAAGGGGYLHPGLLNRTLAFLCLYHHILSPLDGEEDVEEKRMTKECFAIIC